MIAEGSGLEVGATAQHLQLEHDRTSQALCYPSTLESEVRCVLDETGRSRQNNCGSCYSPAAGSKSRKMLQSLGGHLKTGHTWPPQNRSTELGQNKDIYSAAEGVG